MDEDFEIPVVEAGEEMNEDFDMPEEEEDGPNPILKVGEEKSKSGAQQGNADSSLPPPAAAENREEEDCVITGSNQKRYIRRSKRIMSMISSSLKEMAENVGKEPNQENLGTSSKPKTVVYRRRRKTVPSSRRDQDANEDVPIVQQQQPHGTALSNAFLNTTHLPESPKNGCAANVNVHGLDDSNDLNITTYHAVLDAFYSKGGHSWEDDLMLSHLRSVLGISNDDHMNRLKLMIWGSSP